MAKSTKILVRIPIKELRMNNVRAAKARKPIIINSASSTSSTLKIILESPSNNRLIEINLRKDLTSSNR